MKQKKEAKKLLSRIKEQEARIKELIETLQRLQAEFENYKKREEKERLGIRKIHLAELVRELLPVLDDFENALKHHKDHGMQLIYSNFLKILMAQGLTTIDCLEKPFDPYLHEAMLIELSDKDGIVLEELQKGYKFQDIVIRHSKVKVGKKEEKGEDKPEHPSSEDSGAGKAV